MSLKYKFDKANEENQQPESQSEIERYDISATIRSLDVVNSKGVHYSFNYSFLMTAEYSPQENKITLFFNTHIIFISGRNLEALYGDISVHSVKRIICSDKRYSSVKREQDAFVEDIALHQID